MDLFVRAGAPPVPQSERLSVGGGELRVAYVRHRRARRYVLRVRPDGAVRVTIPRGGSRREAEAFVGRNLGWIEEQLRKPRPEPAKPAVWGIGKEILFRGEQVRLESGGVAGAEWIGLGGERVRVRDGEKDLRPAVERHLRRLADRELVSRTLELAGRYGVTVGRVSVRNQRSRWGSCSFLGTISLNWRLVQVPPSVRDYIILHELMHLREMNHSARFWALVELVCPEFREAERWLRRHSGLLR
jgi:hypothetical protein